MKVIAMYLPQFHEVEENSRWWGKGFTEWHAVRQAEKLFDGHEQPKRPLDDNYYDLTEKSVMKWQADLLKKYEVDGLCFYHYWFKDGQKILEKPAENLLSWKDIKIPFCFSWANESWIRTWSKISSGNSWTSKFEPHTADEKMILLQQAYGSEEQWREHFNYLLPFFKDERYIKINNKPLFMIHKPGDIASLKSMRQKWDTWAKEEGLGGIYLIGTRCQKDIYDSVDADYQHEPMNTLIRMRGPVSQDNKPLKLSYDDVWTALLAEEVKNPATYFGAFVKYDDTPRHGNNGVVIYGETVDKFRKYLTELMAKSAAYGNDIVFVNAWNEWGEGMYLEPDEKDGYAYLEVIPYAKKHYEERVRGYNEKKEIMLQGFWGRYDMLAQRQHFVNRARIFDKWLSLKEREINLGEYLSNKGINSVAIYGMGRLGRHLLNDLQQGNVPTEFIIDKRQEIKNIDLPIYNIEAAPVDVDTVVVALDYEYEKVIRELKEKGFKNVLLIENVIDEMSATV